MRRRKSGPTQRIFFATDVHGSERCFRKWLNAREAYGADVLILGGDITGKALVPIVERASGSWVAEVRGETRTVATEEELLELRKTIEMMGYYAIVLDPDRKRELDADPAHLQETFRQVMRESLERWMAIAEEKLPSGFPAFAMLGNDDYPELAEILESAAAIEYGEAGIGELPDGTEVLSCGFSNPTPWDSPREVDEEGLAEMLTEAAERLARPERAIFNIHPPPFDTGLDQAPVIDSEFKPRAGMAGGVELGPVGSTAVREAIERFQPMAGLHGHVHECAAGEEIGSTLCVNPGSNYLMGTLNGALIEANGSGEIRGWQLTEG